MRWIGGGLAGLMLLVGAVWMLQGLDLLPGSFMTGRIFWFWAGLAVAALGAGLLYLVARKRPRLD